MKLCEYLCSYVTYYYFRGPFLFFSFSTSFSFLFFRFPSLRSSPLSPLSLSRPPHFSHLSAIIDTSFAWDSLKRVRVMEMEKEYSNVSIVADRRSRVPGLRTERRRTQLCLPSPSLSHSLLSSSPLDTFSADVHLPLPLLYIYFLSLP